MLLFLRKIIIYTFSICASGCAIIYACVLLLPGRTLGNATEYELWKYKKETINHHFNRPMNVILGDSRCMTGLKPALMNHNFINLALSGTTTFEGYSTLKRFLLQNQIDTLVIGYGMFHYLKSDVLDKWTLRYQFNPTVAELNNLEQVERKYNITLDDQKPNYYLFLKRKEAYYHFPTALRSTFAENIIQDDYKDFIIKDMRRDLGYSNVSKIDSCNGTNTEVEMALTRKKFIPNLVIVSYLDSIYNLSVAHHVKLFFIIPPINAASYKVLKNTKFYAQYKDFIAGLKIKYPEMYIDIKKSYVPNTCFADPQHYNQRGVVFFSNYVTHELIKN